MRENFSSVGLGVLHQDLLFVSAGRLSTSPRAPREPQQRHQFFHIIPFLMNKTHSVVHGRRVLVRFCVLALFAVMSTLSFAQSALDNLVDATEAVDILAPHFARITSDLTVLSPKSPGYAYAEARQAFTELIYEDAQLGIDPAISLATRLESSVSIDPNQTLSDRDLAASKTSGGGSGLASSQGGPSLVLSDPIVNELVVLLTQ